MTIKLVLMLAFTLATYGSIAAQQPSIQQDPVAKVLDDLVTATALNRDTLRPWHMRLSFQLYDLNGKRQENGTVDAWHTDMGQIRWVIASPSLNMTFPAAGENLHEPQTREKYLLQLLLNNEIHPVTQFNSPGGSKIEAIREKFDDQEFHCIRVAPKSEPFIGERADLSPEVCTDVSGAHVRLSADGLGASFVHTSFGRFQNKSVALDTQISYNKIIAISGHVEKLETFDPSTSGLEFSMPLSQIQIPSYMASGHVIKKVPPIYPPAAKNMQLAGEVLVHATITKKGEVVEPIILASPDSILSTSAAETVKLWQYKPFTSNGVPTDVDTVISIYYNMNINIHLKP